MFFPFHIARRYLFSKKSHHAINIISGVSVCGVAIATAALICILSVFNGFQDMVAQLFTAFDPEIKIVPVEGKFMVADIDELEQLRQDPDVAVYTEILEDNALLTINNRQSMAIIKGVDKNFEELTDIKSILVGDGIFELSADVIDYCIPGLNLLQKLGLPIDFHTPIQVLAPRGGESINLIDPRESFNQEELFSSKVCFNVRQAKYDANYIITSIDFARRLFEKQGYVSAIELRLREGANLSSFQARISKQMGEKFRVMGRYEQHEESYHIMQIEKLISYIFLTFILLVACFNIVGSLSMLIIDKKEDALTLRNLGANNNTISNIFMMEGRMISIFGAIVGITIGLTLCYIQQEFGLIRFGSSEGSFIVDAYPVSVHITDVLLVFATVIVVGFTAVWYPVRSLCKKSIN